MSKPILYFITGNLNKAKQFKQILGHSYEIWNQNFDTIQIQGTIQQIIQHKVIESYKVFNKPVIVEDTSLCFNAFKGMPGPYIKWFLKALGPQGLSNMLNSFEDKSGSAVCSIGIMSKSLQKPKIFIGKTQGIIVKPRGITQFGWDPIFQPKGFDKTYAQMSKSQKNQISHRSKAVKQLAQYLCSLSDQQKHKLL